MGNISPSFDCDTQRLVIEPRNTLPEHRQYLLVINPQIVNLKNIICHLLSEDLKESLRNQVSYQMKQLRQKINQNKIKNHLIVDPFTALQNGQVEAQLRWKLQPSRTLRTAVTTSYFCNQTVIFGFEVRLKNLLNPIIENCKIDT